MNFFRGRSEFGSPPVGSRDTPRSGRGISRAGPGDSLRSLAALMAADQPLAHLLMLNARTAQDQLKPGELIKLVVVAPR